MPILSKKQLVSQPVGRPRTAVELAPEGALAASMHGSGNAPVYAFAQLEAGALQAGIAEPNLKKPEAVAATLRSALDQVSSRSRYVTLLIPDIAAHVFMLDFDALPAKAAEALSVLRFRLRKMVPFDVEQAAVSYQILTQDKTTVKVLTAVMPGAILAEYEAAVRAAGYEPGAVLPSSLAALAIQDSLDSTLCANLSSRALTTSITSGHDLLLYRTVELPEEPAERVAEVQRAIAVAAAYFEDKLMARPQQLHYAGAVSVRDFAQAVADGEMAVVEMMPAPSTGVTTAMGPIGFAGIAGALAGAA